MKKTPLKRTGIRRSPKKSKSSVSSMKKKCDSLWSKIVRSRRCCEICGSSDKQLQAHHLIPRGALLFRHNLQNGLCLCSSCHEFNYGQDGKISAHGTPKAFLEWLEANKPELFVWHDENRHKVFTGHKVDYAEVYGRLKTQGETAGVEG